MIRRDNLEMFKDFTCEDQLIRKWTVQERERH